MINNIMKNNKLVDMLEEEVILKMMKEYIKYIMK